MNLKKISANVTQIGIGELEVLISYQTPVAVWDYGTDKGYKTNKIWSPTTTKHINAFLSGEAAEEKPQEYFDVLISEVK